jgi:branched-chain amino acid transport system permease protein
VLWQVLVNGAVAGSVYGLVGLGFGLIFRVYKFFHLAHGALYAFGAYCAYALVSVYHWPPTLGIPAAISAAALFGCVIEIFIYRPLRCRNATALMMLIASLGIYVVIQNILSMVFGDAPVKLRSGYIVEGVNIIYGARITPIQIITVVICVLLSLCMWAWLRHSLSGQMTRAVANDPDLSVIIGIERDRVFLVTIATSSMLAASVGILVGYDTDLIPGMGFSALLMGSAAMLLGGVGSVWGSLFGGIVIGMVQHFGALLVPTQWQDTSIFIVMIACLLIRPRGAFGLPNYRAKV